jgi:hypothetical protein
LLIATSVVSMFLKQSLTDHHPESWSPCPQFLDFVNTQRSEKAAR